MDDPDLPPPPEGFDSFEAASQKKKPAFPSLASSLGFAPPLAIAAKISTPSVTSVPPASSFSPPASTPPSSSPPPSSNGPPPALSSSIPFRKPVASASSTAPAAALTSTTPPAPFTKSTPTPVSVSVSPPSATAAPKFSAPALAPAATSFTKFGAAPTAVSTPLTKSSAPVPAPAVTSPPSSFSSSSSVSSSPFSRSTPSTAPASSPPASSRPLVNNEKKLELTNKLQSILSQPRFPPPSAAVDDSLPPPPPEGFDSFEAASQKKNHAVPSLSSSLGFAPPPPAPADDDDAPPPPPPSMMGPTPDEIKNAFQNLSLKKTAQSMNNNDPSSNASAARPSKPLPFPKSPINAAPPSPIPNPAPTSPTSSFNPFLAAKAREASSSASSINPSSSSPIIGEWQGGNTPPTQTRRASGRPNCSHCGKTINESILEMDNKPYHPNCVSCNKCFQRIEGEIMAVQGKLFHPTCLRCAVCNCSLVGQAFSIRGNDLLCVNHARQSAIPNNSRQSFPPSSVDHRDYASQSCAGCSESLASSSASMVALFGTPPLPWHTACISCNQCGITMADTGSNGKFFSHSDGSILCEKDYHLTVSVKCHYCAKPIDGNCISIANDSHQHAARASSAQPSVIMKTPSERLRFHEKCFICSRCNVFLKDEYYQLQYNSLLCYQCAAGGHE